MEKDYIIARVKDAFGENFDKFEHTIIVLYDNEDNISNTLTILTFISLSSFIQDIII